MQKNKILFQKVKSLNYKKISFIILLILMFFILLNKYKLLFLGLGLVALNMIITIYKKFFTVPFEFEISTISTILLSIYYNTKIGSIIGICMLSAALVMCSRFSFYNISKFVGLIIIGILASVFQFVNLTILVILLVLLYNLLNFIFYFITGMSLFSNFSHRFSNILFNISLILLIAPFF